MAVGDFEAAANAASGKRNGSGKALLISLRRFKVSAETAHRRRGIG